MAANSEGKVSPGSPFRAPPATIWNNMVDAGRAFADGQLSNSDPGPTRPRPTDLLKLKNSSAANRRKGEILKIDGKVIETVTDEHIWLDGVAVTDDCRFGILKAPAESEEVVIAQVSGVCMALVNVTDEDHTFAAAADGEYVLQSGSSGPLEILFAPAGTGELECAVRFAGGGGESLVGFVIESFTEEVVNEDESVTPAYATCRVTFGSCNGSVAGADEYGMIRVYDQLMRCLFNEPAGDLIGRRGHAARFRPTEDEATELDEPVEYGYALERPCRYQALGLCCPDEA
jgi:hypothetical protein